MRLTLVLPIAVLFGFTAAPGKADVIVFTDPARLVSSGATGLFGSYDISGLEIVDTADGFKVTGSMSIAMEGPDDVLMVGAFILTAARQFDVGLGTPLTPIAHMNGTLATTGTASVSSLVTNTLFYPHLLGACGSEVALGSGYPSALTPGSFSISHTGNNINPGSPCDSLGDNLNPNELQQSFALGYFYTGSGSISIDFGHSLLSEAVATVPEPSGISLFAGAVLAVLTVRWRCSRRSPPLP